MGKSTNIFVIFLELLGVKHTKSFSGQFFNAHPHKYNLFGLSKMLSDYGVENAAISIPDKKNDLTEIQTPFVAQFGGDFAVVSEVEPDKVSYYWRGLRHSLPVAKFMEAWTGIVLLAESSEKSIEPDYREHRKAEQVNLLKGILLLSTLAFIVIIMYIYHTLYADAGISLLLLINLSGMYISRLLLLRQMKVQSRYADKICSLFKQKDCNNVLESKGAKLFGLIGLSETGFGYFTVNVLLLLISPALITAIALLNILTLPFTLWSVWYQWSKARQWCVLCLIVLVLLWFIFIIDLLFGYIQFSAVITGNGAIYPQLLIAACCYPALILGVNRIIPKLNTDETVQSLQQSINSIKADEDVFMALLKKQPFYETGDCDSVIRFGNPDGRLRLTVLSNPYCNPCSKMHERMEELLKQVNNDISVQYILSSFKEELNATNKYLIAACLLGKSHHRSVQKGESAVNRLPQATNHYCNRVFNDWFEKGKSSGDDYFKSFDLDMDNPEIEIEFEKHEAWKRKTQIRATPTVLVNGYRLPESYKMEDLRYFTDLDI